MLTPGDTFVNDDRAGGPSHLWIVITRPTKEREVVIVNVTSWRSLADPTCVLQPGDHQFVRRKSYIEYRRAKRVSVDEIRVLLNSGGCVEYDTASPSLLERILDGAAERKDYIPHKCRDILRDQGLIPDNQDNLE